MVTHEGGCIEYNPPNVVVVTPTKLQTEPYIVILFCKKSLRYQRGNQNPEIEEGQTTIIISYHNNVCTIRKIHNGH